ncbi:MAG TPA: hypothetical protein VMT00_09700 [Thermoanaerobaculia bacterium]|nr:hypothetical protein [Thermoanaerobaculia bacterium]
MRSFVASCATLSLLAVAVSPAHAAVEKSKVRYEELAPASSVSGFRVVAVYTNDANRVMGARFRHERTRFTFDALELESVPQAFIWIETYPTSDMGEPHTQEHLLLGKGNVGRAAAALESMSITSSSAFTAQWRTCYHVHTAAGPDVFFRLLESQLDALLYPDYTDEEIRREVRNFGVTENPGDGLLRLEEKGTVYNEMVSSSDNPFRRLFRDIDHLTYGPRHPLAFDSGGWPSAIREMKAEHIRKFHRDTHFLSNMGMIASFPTDVGLSTILGRVDAMLTALGKDEEPRRPPMTESTLPAPSMAPEGTIRITDVPHKNDQQPGPVTLVWPPVRSLDVTEKLLLDLFVSNIAGDATTDLYKTFIDSRTRAMDLGARGVFGFAGDDQGQPIVIGLLDVATQHMTEEKLAAVRSRAMAEIGRIASFEDGSPELAEFNDRIRSRIVELRRDLSKFVNSPPGFGFRGTGSSWLDHLHRLSKTAEPRKSLTLKSELAAIESLLDSKENFWRRRLESWRITGSSPYVLAAKSSPELLERDERERQERIAAEVQRLAKQYGVDDPQDAIRRYKAEYDATSEELEQIAGRVEPPPFVDSPPLTLDEQLKYRAATIGGIPLASSTFENMSSATAGVAFRLDGIRDEDLVYVSALPNLLTNVGVVEKGKPVSYEEMAERLRNEILLLNAGFSTNIRTGRVEVVVRGAGNDVAEAKRAAEWMSLVVNHPDLRPENLSRIRDVVDQLLGSLRNTMRGSEESWVNNPANAWRRQTDPLYLAADSFLTRSHNVLRLRWLLKDAGDDASRTAVTGYFDRLATAGESGSRDDLEALLAALQRESGAGGEVGPLREELRPLVDAFAALPSAARTVVIEAARDLAQALAGVPDGSLAGDWRYLCSTMRSDLLVAPAEALARIDRVRGAALRRGNARMFLIGSSPAQKELASPLEALVKNLKEGASERVRRSAVPLIASRLLERDAKGANPLFVGLVAPNMKGGVLHNTARGVYYADTDRESLLDYLSSRLYTGYGAHGIFMKTWGAGLAYSNGFRGSPGLGIIGYYAERTPELPQTLRFVIDLIRSAEEDPKLVDYAIAQVFTEFRAASAYEVRGEAMAADLVDGVTPDLVRKFRSAILSLRSMPALAGELHERMPRVYGRVLPGMGVPARSVEGASFFVIGPDRQLELYEGYLRTVEGDATRLHRLYPRDFWMTAR